MRHRIANFLRHYPRPGGTTVAVTGLSRALARLGWEVLIYCCGQDGEAPGRGVDDGGLRFVRFGSPRRNPFYLDPRLLSHVLRNEDGIELLVITGMFAPHTLALARAARKGGIPYVVWPHDPYHPALLRRGRWKKLIYGALCEKRHLKAASAIQLLAESHKSLLMNYGVRCPAFVVPNGFDPGPASEPPAQLRPGPGPEGSPRLVYMGRLEMHNKGLDLLLQAVALGMRQHRLPGGLRLDIIGADWGDERRLKGLTRELQIEATVRFLGRVPGTSAAIIAPYDVLVLPSRWDGFGLVVLEAMVAGKPVVVSAEAGISCYVREAGCGYVVKPDASSICAGIVRATEARDEWPRMGAAGREFATKHLTWDQCAEQASREYEAVLRRTRIPG